MERNKIILIAIAILVIALIAVGGYILTTNGNHGSINKNVTVDNQTNNTTDVIMIDENGNVTNDTVVGDDTPRNDTNTSNETYRVYNPQSDSYVTVIGEGYDAEVDRWYTYDTDGVRYYNTRIK
jgi:flagellar basal body-associated protein FliL